jgi:hypothetical protein
MNVSLTIVRELDMEFMCSHLYCYLMLPAKGTDYCRS